MKKNKSLEEKSINRELFKNILINILVFITFIVIIGLVVSILINYLFTANTKDTLKRTADKVSTSLVLESAGGNTYYYLSGLENPISYDSYFFFYEDEDSAAVAITDHVLNIFITNYSSAGTGLIVSTNTEEYRATVPSYEERFYEIRESVLQEEDLFILDVSKLDNFLEETYVIGSSQYTFLTYSTTVKNQNEEIEPLIRYVKTCIVLDIDNRSQNSVWQLYIYTALVMVILATMISFVLGHRSMRVLVISLEKQKQFVNDASHELKTPLAVIQSHLEGILTKSDKTVLDVSEEMASSLREVARLNHLVDDLLSLARADSDRTQFVFEKTDIKGLVEDVTSSFYDLAMIQNKKFKVKCEEVTATVDHAKIKQLLIIIIDNAFKYTEEKDSIYLSVHDAGSTVNINLYDTGIGISLETKKHIFDRFYREEKARSRAKGGTGLGMPIAQTIVLGHKGTISVDNNKPKGTIIYISISKDNA